MARKPRRRPVHYFTMGFRDGAVTACLPIRKPSKKTLTQQGRRVDDDFVCEESFYGPDEAVRWDLEQRIRTADLMSNRLNTRRAIRELVIPELQSLNRQLAKIEQQLSRVEAAITSCRDKDEM